MHPSPARPLPRATYRLQLNKHFTFAHVERIASYLGRLCISHAYLSPILKARPGSTHGYDTVDHTLINPELGTIDDFRRMAARLKAEGIGIILDIVPNHMGVGGSENPYWLDLLEWGRDSRYADWFDVNWSPSEPSLQNKVLAPFLGSAFDDALNSGSLSLRYENGAFAVWAEDTHKLPVDPRTCGDILQHGDETLHSFASRFQASSPEGAEELKRQLADVDPAELENLVARFNSPEGREEFVALIEKQNWRAARYSVAADDINYRRFFIVSDLGAIRIEREEVFDHAHRLIFQLVEEGLVDGLRIDHIDGLYDPRQYGLRLREKCPRPIYLVVEKILAPHEKLRADWDVDGTTGYEFANAVAQLLVDPAAEQSFSEFYHSFTEQNQTLDAIERDAKLEIVDYEMAAELDALTSRLQVVARSDQSTQDLTRNGIRNGLRHFVASMRVYRTYVDGGSIDPRDTRDIAVALAEARKMAPTLDPAIFDFIEKVATAELCRTSEYYDEAAVLEAAMRLQQFTGPVMAKGLEDTALYRYNRLIALSDVGERPDRFSAGVDSFHDFNRWRAEHAPGGMLTSSSHDTKRGEDVRARIAALTLVPDEWQDAVRRWQGMLVDAGIEAINPNDLYYLFQQLVGAWPADMSGHDWLDSFRRRSLDAMIKAVREARRHSTWTAPGEPYEKAIEAALTAMLQPGPLFDDLRAFADRIGQLGARNSLIAATLKLTSPGMPDIYQGSELYEQSMVDPDNRRPVDFDLRERMLDGTGDDIAAALEQWQTGAAKLGVIHRLLQLRCEKPELFAMGSYEPLSLQGERSDRALAFVRRHGSDAVLVVACLGRARDIAECTLDLPDDLRTGKWKPVLSDAGLRADLSLSGILGALPVAVFVRL